jgi:hypothetical protein
MTSDQRRQNCFRYSMNGKLLPFGSEAMLARDAYASGLDSNVAVFDGLCYAVTATAMLIPIGTVRSRIFQVLELLDMQLREAVDGGLGHCLMRRMSVAAISIRPAAQIHGEQLWMKAF